MNQLRDTLNKNPALMIAGAAVLTIAALGFVAMRVLGVAGTTEEVKPVMMAYYYDQNTKELFTLPTETEWQVERPSGEFEGEPAGVRAYVYACGPCNDESKRFTAWLAKPLPEDQRKPDSEAFLMRRPEDKKWVRNDSPEGNRIMQENRRRCAGEQVNLCRPDPT